MRFGCLGDRQKSCNRFAVVLTAQMQLIGEVVRHHALILLDYLRLFRLYPRLIPHYRAARREGKERRRQRSLWNYFSFSLFGSGAYPLTPWDRGRATLGVALPAFDWDPNYSTGSLKALKRRRARLAGRTLGTSNDRSSARESPAMAINSD